MPKIAYKPSVSTGHPCWPPTVPSSWSPDVLAEAQNVIRKGDTWVVHCCPPGCHVPVSIGDNTVIVNGRPAQRIGSPMDCGDAVDTGAGTVIIP